MTTTTLKAAEERRPSPTSPQAGVAITQNFAKALDVSAEFTAANDELRVCVLPAQHVPVDLLVAFDDIDSNGSPAVVFDVGIEDTIQTGSDTTDLNAFIDGSTVAQAGGVARLDQIAGLQIAPVDYDRYVTITCTTAPGTDQDGDVVGWFSYRPALRGE